MRGFAREDSVFATARVADDEAGVYWEYFSRNDAASDAFREQGVW